MAHHPEQLSQLSPAEVFDGYIAARQAQLEYLSAGLKQGLEIVDDFTRVNALLANSPRPDLMMTERAPMMPLDSPAEVGRKINNFIPRWRGFGVRIMENVYDEYKGEEVEKFVGRRPLTDEERSEYFLMGARGSLSEHYAFAEDNGVSIEMASDMAMQTHITEPAFMRMWLLMPEFTEKLMDMCLDTDRTHYLEINEELFVAYSVMSRLVDMQDRGVVKKDGSVDGWMLCH